MKLARALMCMASLAMLLVVSSVAKGSPSLIRADASSVLVAFKADDGAVFYSWHSKEDFRKLEPSVVHEGLISTLQSCQAMISNKKGDDRVLHSVIYYYAHVKGEFWGEVMVRNDSMHHPNGFMSGDMAISFQGKTQKFTEGRLYDQTGWVVQLGKPILAVNRKAMDLLSARWPSMPFDVGSIHWKTLIDVRGEQHNAQHTRQTGSPFAMHHPYDVFNVWLYGLRYPVEERWRLLGPILQNVYEIIGTTRKGLYFGEEALGEELDDERFRKRFQSGRPCLLTDYSSGWPEPYRFNKRYAIDSEEPKYGNLGEGSILYKWGRSDAVGHLVETFGRKDLPVVSAWEKADEALGSLVNLDPQSGDKPWYPKAARDKWNEDFKGALVNGWRFPSEEMVLTGYGRNYFDPGHFNLISRIVAGYICSASQVSKELIHTSMHFLLEPQNWDTPEEDVEPRLSAWNYSPRIAGWTISGALLAYVATEDGTYLKYARWCRDLILEGKLDGGAVYLDGPEDEARYVKGWQLAVIANACRIGSQVDVEGENAAMWTEAGIMLVKPLKYCYVPGQGFSEYFGFKGPSPLEGKVPTETFQSGTVSWVGTRHWMNDPIAWAYNITEDEQFAYGEEQWVELMARDSYPRYQWPDRNTVRWHLESIVAWGHDGELLD